MVHGAGVYVCTPLKRLMLLYCARENSPDLPILYGIVFARLGSLFLPLGIDIHDLLSPPLLHQGG